MEITATTEDFVAWINEALGVEDYEVSEGTYIFRIASRPGPRADGSYSGRETAEVQLNRDKLEEIIESLSSKEEREETILYHSNGYEVLVSDRSSLRLPLFPGPRDEIVQPDRENGVTYTLSRPTDEYLLFLMYKLSDISPMRDIWPPALVSRILRDRLEPESDVLALLKQTSRRFMTLRMESERNRSFTDFSRYANSFLFQLSFNLDRAFSPQFYLDELVRAGRIARVRRARRIEEMEAPRRYYIPDVVYHYQMGVATDNPPLEYLSYYHVAEHFFEEIFNDDLINRVQDTITRPDFSYRSKRNIRKLLDEVTDRIRLRDERVTFNEREALRLTIQKHVDIEELAREIRSYDESLLEYYKHNRVPFSDGNTVNLEDPDVSRAIDAIAGRIYKTRNAIVHSKEGERGRYIPFRHDRILVREVPLIRFIAESILLSTSDIIGR